MPSKWGIWCVKTDCWVTESTKHTKFKRVRCEFPTRKKAEADKQEWCHRDFTKDYEVRKI
jgi:hypothetical protein